MYRRTSSLILIIMAISMLLWSPFANAATRVDPSRFILYAEAGGRTTGAIKVINTGENAAAVSAVVYDWALDETDGLLLFEGGARPESINELIKFNPKQFTLAPGESQLVRFSLAAPESIEGIGEYRGIVFFEQQETANPDDIGAVMVTEVGTTIYLVLTPMQKEFRLVDAATSTSGDKVSCVYTVENSGTSHIRYDLSYSIVNQKSELVFEGALAKRVLLPGDTRTIQFPLECALEPGKYNLILDFEFQTTDKHLTRTLAFEVPE